MGAEHLLTVTNEVRFVLEFITLTMACDFKTPFDIISSVHFVHLNHTSVKSWDCSFFLVC
jgi:hypothetical protein